MPRTTLPALIKRIEARPHSAVVFLHGEEEYTRERTVQRILEIVLDPPTRDFNLDQVRGGEVQPESLASLIATPPMMSDYRIVVVRDAQGLSVKAREVVEQAVQRENPGLVLILVATIPASSKAKFYDTLRAAALSVEFPLVDPDDLPTWVIEHCANEHDVEIDTDAARALSAAIGPYLGILAIEVEKIVSYIGDRRRITKDDVAAVGGYVPRVDRWGWFDTVGSRRYEIALSQLPDLLVAGESGVGLLIGLGNHLLRLAIFAAGGSEALERQLPGNQRWLIKRLQPQGREWSVRSIDLALAHLLRADRLLKTASIPDRLAVEEVLLRMAADRDSEAQAGSRPRAGAGRATGRRAVGN